ncbi:serine hydrolase domain-containing protein [Longispora sp. NPDC051575]|uniref:serine hydrolase domain-containing protein n=1 Tax=Longispora sp. NPDC051575 TaxID=3154943 RepID=UPI00344390AD
MSRRRGWAAVLAVALATTLPACTREKTPPTGTARGAQGDAVVALARDHLAKSNLRAVLLRVTVDGKDVATEALGESLTGVPASTAMRFRNGAVAFAYISTLLLKFVDEKKVGLDDPVGRWLPTLPEADKVTLRMLANHTSGYPDYETDPVFQRAFYADPFRSWSYDQRLRIAFGRPQVSAPGTNWSYAHTNFMILGEALAKIGGEPLDVLLREKVLKPMGLTHTTAADTAAIPEPVLHAFSSERRQVLGIAAPTPFYEETTSWNADWGTPTGASQTSTIGDLDRTAIAVGTGAVLSKASYHAMTDERLLGFGQKLDSCVPSCFTQMVRYNYGLGVVRSGDWLLQNPLLGGYAATMAYLPAGKVAISVAVTFQPGAFDCEGHYANASDQLFREIGALMAPDDSPPPAPAPAARC